jgi:two-component system cell cycle response regulator DivK
MRLELSGEFEVQLAKDAYSGIEKAKSSQPEIILMDMDLPGMSGADAMKILKQSSETSHIPIIAVTAHAMEATRIAALSEGFDGYCAKPIEFPKLLDMIRKLAPSPS